MDDQRRFFSEEIPNVNRRKQKSRTALMAEMQDGYMRGMPQLSPNFRSKSGMKASKKSFMNESPPFFQQQLQQRKVAPKIPESACVSEYRGLRRRYLMLEEESLTLGGELIKAEDEIKTLEDEKLSLLDQLVVLEGLVDPSESHPHH